MVDTKGDPSLARSKMSLKAMLRALKKEKEVLWVKLNHIEEQSKERKQVVAPLFLVVTVERYEQVFHFPLGLPPRRNREHSIVLKQGQDPVSVRPYYYLQGQKDEIERLKADML